MEKLKEKYLGKKVEIIKDASYHYSPRAMEDGPEFEIVIRMKLVKPEIGSEGTVIAIGRHRFDKSRILAAIVRQEGENFLVNLDEVSLMPKPLLIVGTKVIHNTLIYWVEHQDESIRTDPQGKEQVFEAKDGFKIVSNYLPDLDKEGKLFIRGHSNNFDLNVVTISMDTKTEVEDLKNKIHEAVREFNEAGGFEKPLPEIELKGVDPKWKYCAKDESENIFVYDVIPVDEMTCWRVTDSLVDSFENARALKQTQFEEMKKLPWKESLHKIKHI